jgi:hypothetical protein
MKSFVFIACALAACLCFTELRHEICDMKAVSALLLSLVGPLPVVGLGVRIAAQPGARRARPYGAIITDYSAGRECSSGVGDGGG